MAENKGTGYADNPVRHKDSPADFSVREAGGDEVQENARKRLQDDTARIAELQARGGHMRPWHLPPDPPIDADGDG